MKPGTDFGRAGLRLCAALRKTLRAELPDGFNVPRLPSLVDRGFSRRIEPENREVSLPRNGRQPVALVTRGRLGAEIDVRAAVGVLRRIVARTKRREVLAIGEVGGILRLVQR